MPQQQVGRRQRGSILALTLVITAVLTTGAAGLLITTGVWESDRVNTLERRSLLHAAETGLIMGARWLRQDINEPTFAAEYRVDDGVEKPITPGGYINLNGALVKVTYVYRAGPNAVFMISRATAENCIQTLQLEWQIQQVGTTTFNDGFATLSDIGFTGWTEAIVNCDYTP